MARSQTACLNQRARNLQVHTYTTTTFGSRRRVILTKILTAAATGESSSIPQNDGASETQNGSNLQEPEYNVEVKLSDLQDDPNNPLYSVKNFSDLGLWVLPFGMYMLFD